MAPTILSMAVWEDTGATFYRVMLMAYTHIQSTWDRVKDKVVPYWLAPHGILQEVTRDRKPTENHHPLVWGDRPVPVARLKELFEQAERNPLKYARLVEAEHGIKNWEVDDGA